jgi:ribosomal protein S12 methylthiotransferase accessory factor
MNIRVTFPGGMRVDADINGVVIRTDQPILFGGEGTAPGPFVHFLASIGTCAGIHVLTFCRQRDIPTEGLSLIQRMEYVRVGDESSRLSRVHIDVVVPPDFPKKYYNALVKVVEQCSVRKIMLDPPEFEIRTIVTEA